MIAKTLVAWNTGDILYTGVFDSWKACLEAAVSENVSLDYLLLEDLDLGPVNLDGARMNYARINRCRMAGANLSEGSFIKSEWSLCDLRGACFSDSVLAGARLLNTRMNELDVGYADLRGVLFSCPQFLKCDFTRSTSLASSAFFTQGQICPMSRIPVYIRGLGMDAVFLDEHVIVGNRTVLGREKLDSLEGLKQVFAERGLKPHPELLRHIWDAIRTDRFLRHAAHKDFFKLQVVYFL